MESDEVKVYYVALTRAKNKCVVFVWGALWPIKKNF
jgi:ATP-dependent exoDNAse (exonuclease V) beta subunit